jgi:hypothetical protein
VDRMVARGRPLILGREPQTATVLEGLRKLSVRVRDVLESWRGAPTLLRHVAADVAA